MKKLFLILFTFLSLGLASYSQEIYEGRSDIRAVAGASILSDKVYVNLEVGKTSGKHTYSAIAESWDSTTERQYSVGARYLYAFSADEPTFLVGGSALFHLASGHAITLRPEVGAQVRLQDNISLIGSVGFPITQGDAGLFRPVRLQAGLQLAIKL